MIHWYSICVVLLTFSLPRWADRVMNDGDAFQRLFEHLFSIMTVTDDMKKFRSGFLLKEILDRFTSKSETVLTPDRSMWLYFAHGDLFVPFYLF